MPTILLSRRAASQRRAALANIVGTVAEDGATKAFYSSVGPSAIYDAPNDRTIFAWEGWDGERLANIRWYDHALEQFSSIVNVGIPMLTDDDHGIPALCKDHEDYWHVFGGAHGGNMQHASTVNPDDLTAWTVRTAISGNYGYPHPNVVGDKIYLFMRNTVVNELPLKLRITTALSGGVPTWGSETTVLNFEGANGDRAYATSFFVVGTEIWFIACVGLLNDSERRHVYFIKYETTTGNFKNFAGTTTVIPANYPVTRTQLDTSFRIYEHTGTDTGNDVPVMLLDGSNNPYIFFAVGPNEGPYAIKLIYNIGAGWVTEDTGAGGIGRYFTMAAVRNADGSIDLYYPDPDVLWPDNWFDTPSPMDGHFNRRTRTAAGAWPNNFQRILTATEFPIGRPIPVLNAHADAQLAMTEIADGVDDDLAGSLRVFLYGKRGFLDGPISSLTLYDGLLAFYNLNEASGDRQDSHTGNLDLADTNTVGSGAGVGVGQTAAEFVAASSERLVHADNAAFDIENNTRTFAFWARPDSLAAVRTFIAKGNGVFAADSAYHVQASASGNLLFQAKNAAGAGTLFTLQSAAGVVAVDTWIFVVASYDASNGIATLRSNNGTKLTVSAPGGTAPSTLSFAVGSLSNGSQPMSGRIQCVGIWNRILNSSEQSFLYNLGNSARLYATLGDL